LGLGAPLGLPGSALGLSGNPGAAPNQALQRTAAAACFARVSLRPLSLNVRRLENLHRFSLASRSPRVSNNSSRRVLSPRSRATHRFQLGLGHDVLLSKPRLLFPGGELRRFFVCFGVLGVGRMLGRRRSGPNGRPVWALGCRRNFSVRPLGPSGSLGRGA